MCIDAIIPENGGLIIVPVKSSFMAGSLIKKTANANDLKTTNQGNAGNYVKNCLHSKRSCFLHIISELIMLAAGMNRY